MGFLPRAALGSLAVLALVGSGAGAGAREPFEVASARVAGRPVEAFAVSDGMAEQMVVLSVEGTPPDEVRWISRLPRGALGGALPGFRVPREVVAVDVADLDPAEGLEALLISPRELRVVGLADGTPRRVIPMEPPLPLPARTRQLSRLQAIREWEGPGRLAALIPTWNGALLVPIRGGRPKLLAMPIVAAYETMDRRRPVYQGYAAARHVWPAIGLEDDDGDGRLDLLAASRYHLWVFRAGPEGLPTAPTRRTRFAPFSFEGEQRNESHVLRAYFDDLDGDGRVEVVEHRSTGTLLESHSTTRIFRGAGGGADPSATAAGELVDDRGFAGIEVFDLDGDGRKEILHSVVPFGILQVARVLTTRRVETELQVFHLPEGEDGQPVESWSAELRYPLDFSSQRVEGLLPNPAGDWNGDGLMDLVHGDGPDAVRIRLGQVGARGPGFGRPVARQPLPFSDLALIADLNSDGLDDLITYDTLDREGRLYLAVNRGILPGTPPRLSPRPPRR